MERATQSTPKSENRSVQQAIAKSQQTEVSNQARTESKQESAATKALQSAPIQKAEHTQNDFRCAICAGNRVPPVTAEAPPLQQKATDPIQRFQCGECLRHNGHETWCSKYKAPKRRTKKARRQRDNHDDGSGYQKNRAGGDRHEKGRAAAERARKRKAPGGRKRK